MIHSRGSAPLPPSLRGALGEGGGLGGGGGLRSKPTTGAIGTAGPRATSVAVPSGAISWLGVGLGLGLG